MNQILLMILWAASLHSSQAHLEPYQNKMKALDPMWKVEQGFLEGLLGKAGAQRLEELFLEILPTKEKQVSISEAAQKIHILIESALAGYVEKGTQGNLKAAEKLILDLAAGHSPRVAANAGSFLAKVWNRLPWFCTLTAKHKDGHEVHLAGQDAIDFKWKEIQKMKTQNIKLQQLEMLVTFMFLLPEKDQKKVHTITSEVYKQAGETVAPSQSASSSSVDKEGKAAKAKPKAVVSSVSEAAQMFK